MCFIAALNNVIQTGNWPAKMKTDIAKPLYKGGSAKYAKNYRPISLLSCIAQLLEKPSLKVMSGFSVRFDLLSNRQYGFVAERGTQTLLETSTDCLHAGLDKSCV